MLDEFGLYELTIITIIFSYMTYQCYKLWDDAHKNRGEDEQ